MQKVLEAFFVAVKNAEIRVISGRATERERASDDPSLAMKCAWNGDYDQSAFIQPSDYNKVSG